MGSFLAFTGWGTNRRVPQAVRAEINTRNQYCNGFMSGVKRYRKDIRAIRISGWLEVSVQPGAGCVGVLIMGCARTARPGECCNRRCSLVSLSISTGNEHAVYAAAHCPGEIAGQCGLFFTQLSAQLLSGLIQRGQNIGFHVVPA